MSSTVVTTSTRVTKSPRPAAAAVHQRRKVLGVTTWLLREEHSFLICLPSSTLKITRVKDCWYCK